jgi:hypothetical protein
MAVLASNLCVCLRLVLADLQIVAILTIKVAAISIIRPRFRHVAPPLTMSPGYSQHLLKQCLAISSQCRFEMAEI